MSKPPVFNMFKTLFLTWRFKHTNPAHSPKISERRWGVPRNTAEPVHWRSFCTLASEHQQKIPSGKRRETRRWYLTKTFHVMFGRFRHWQDRLGRKRYQHWRRVLVSSHFRQRHRPHSPFYRRTNVDVKLSLRQMADVWQRNVATQRQKAWKTVNCSK